MLHKIQWLFRIAGWYGVAVTAPNFLLEKRLGEDYPPQITHPEFYYGFLAACLAWQVMYLVIATDPIRYRIAMLIGGSSKLVFFISVAILYQQDRVNGLMVVMATIDMILAILFLIAWTRTPNEWPAVAAKS
jgi:hypothetical protein